MKIVRLLPLFVCGLLVLAGCFNPVLNSPSRLDGREVEGAPEDDPVTITVNPFGKNASSRSVAGYSWDQLAGSDINVINFVQLVVVDPTAEAGERVVWVDEHRRTGSADTEAFEFNVDKITPSHTYAFLLLMGQWERDNAAEVDEGSAPSYIYRVKPTLLKSGFTQQAINSESNSITLTMRRPKVDTSFIAIGGTAENPREPQKYPDGGKYQMATILSPRDWSIKWTLKFNGENALGKLLEAEKVFNPVANTVSVQVKGYAGENTPAQIDNGLVDFNGKNIVTMDIKGYTQVANIGKKYSANFRLDYVPFNLTTLSEWNDKLPSTYWQGTLPTWYIRNGVNNTPQDLNTDFGAYTVAGFTNSANGNGAVVFAVRAESANEGINPPTNLTIADGGKITDDAMKFTPGGWTTPAPDVYYWFGDTKPTDYSVYKKVDPSPALTQNAENEISKDTIGNNWKDKSDAWVVLLKDGKFGEPAKLVYSSSIKVGGGEFNTGDEEPEDNVDDSPKEANTTDWSKTIILDG
jgi:hypothetical protein